MSATTGIRCLFTDLTIVGTRAEVDQLRALAYTSGRLVHMSAPRPAGPGDPRLRVVIRLAPTPR